MEEGQNEEKKEIVKKNLDESLSRMTTKEHFVNSIKAIISAIPVVGGPISSLMNDYIPNAKEERMVQFLEDLSNEFDKVKDQIDVTYVTTDEFAYIFEKTLKATMENYQQEKIDAFQAILINGLINTDITSDEKEYFLDRVINLTSLHIKMLSFLNNPKKYLENMEIDIETVKELDFPSMMIKALPGVDINVLKSAFHDLYTQGFTNTDKNIFGAVTAGRGIQIIQGRVSPYGKRFIEFCSLQ